MVKIKKKKLIIIKNQKGNILKIGPDFDISKYKDIYFSELKKNQIKAWKYNNSYSQNIVVIAGSIKIACFKTIGKNKIKIFKLDNKKNFSMISIPKSIWYGFKNCYNGKSIIVNFIKKKYNNSSSKIMLYEKFKINW